MCAGMHRVATIIAVATSLVRCAASGAPGSSIGAGGVSSSDGSSRVQCSLSQGIIAGDAGDPGDIKLCPPGSPCILLMLPCLPYPDGAARNCSPIWGCAVGVPNGGSVSVDQ